MIADQDRSGWFGASDIRYIVGNRNTKSFEKWWLKKLGLDTSTFTNEAMEAGTNFEHPILEFINSPEMDKQILIPKLLLRVNLDGNSNSEIFEVKTYRFKSGFKLHNYYVQQVNIQMFAWKLKFGFIPKANIVSYGLTERDYKNYFNTICEERLSFYPIEYNEKFIEEEFLPNIHDLSKKLKDGRWFC